MSGFRSVYVQRAAESIKGMLVGASSSHPCRRRPLPVQHPLMPPLPPRSTP